MYVMTARVYPVSEFAPTVTVTQPLLISYYSLCLRLLHLAGNAEADSVHWQLNDSIRLAAISTAALATAASACDGDLITRLEWIAHNATSRLTASVSGLVLTVQQCVPAFVFHARQHQEAVDKRLQQAEEEHVDNVKVLRLYQQLLQACDGPVKVSEEVFAGACKLLETVDGFSGVSTVQVPVVDAVTVNPASYVQDSVDFCRSIITHAPWLPRGDRSSLLFNLVDHIGEPVHGITAVDIVCGFSTETAGWSVVSVFVQLNEVSVSVELAADCSNTTTLEANIFGASLQMQLKVHIHISRSSFNVKCIVHTLSLCRPLLHRLQSQ